jgi:hypothetical protein
MIKDCANTFKGFLGVFGHNNCDPHWFRLSKAFDNCVLESHKQSGLITIHETMDGIGLTKISLTKLGLGLRELYDL